MLIAFSTLLIVGLLFLVGSVGLWDKLMQTLALMFVIHGVIVSFSGVNPLRFFRKVWPVLTFAFTSRSSAASIPLSIEAQTRRLGIPSSIASFAASFGATIGQNGCAGLYPAMLAVMVAPTVGINPLDPVWIASLVAIVTLSSVGVAGVGGGATFAALIVLPAMGLPVSLVALLCGIGLLLLSAGMAALALLSEGVSAFDIGWRMALCSRKNMNVFVGLSRCRSDGQVYLHSLCSTEISNATSDTGKPIAGNTISAAKVAPPPTLATLSRRRRS